MANYLRILALAAPLCALLAACGNAEPAKARTPVREDWKISARFDVRKGDLEVGKYQLIVPFVLGDIYGRPDSKTYLTPPVSDDDTFELDLNQSHDAMLAELAVLERTYLRDDRMSIVPRDALIAMISPEIVDQRFKSLGNTNWVNEQTGNSLQLIYFDRPARLSGHDLDVEVAEAGYVWVELPSSPEIAHAVPQPEELVLAFFAK